MNTEINQICFTSLPFLNAYLIYFALPLIQHTASHAEEKWEEKVRLFFPLYLNILLPE